MDRILSVGIDIGTSTTQVIFSRLSMENTAGLFSVPHVDIVSKEILYKSRPHRTPLKTEALIDAEKVREIVSGEFRNAGYTPADTESGAVIITGESARKENSDAVLMQLSDFAGDFVVAAAGPDMESLIAGKGSGAFQYSIDHHCRVINLDIGGGTANAVYFDDGKVTARGCVDIGGRLICVDGDGIVQKLSPAAAVVAANAGVDISVGRRASVSELMRATDRMAGLLESFLGLASWDPLLEKIRTPGSSVFRAAGKADAIFFSGGVADIIYRDCDDLFSYGDIGVLLGRSIRRSLLCMEFEMPDTGETICATVVGAGMYTTAISGSTISYSGDIFPLKNVPVMKLDPQTAQECFLGREKPLIRQLHWFLSQTGSGRMVLAMEGKRNPDYEELKRAAECIWKALDGILPVGEPVLLVIEHDIAKAMGELIRRLSGGRRQVVAADSIQTEEGDYIDFGKPVMNGMVIPVVIKTMVFG